MTSLEKIQKAALARLEAGEDLEHILQDYADYEEDLRPLLEEVSGLSIGSLMNSPKAKVKAKNQTETNKALVPLLLALVLSLGAGIYLFLGSNSEPTIITVQPIEVTAIPPLIDPTPISQTVQGADYCASLGQLSRDTVINYQVVNQPTNSGEIRIDSEEPVDDGSFAMAATPLPMPTMESIDAIAVMPEAAPMEEVALSGTSGSTGSGGEGGGATLPDTGGGTGGDVARDADTAVVSGVMPIVATSVASYDERESSETDAYSMATTTSITAPVVAAQVSLQPLNAGEIDDNADWDTYQEYRRNFLAQTYMTYGVKDLDTTDRQIIRVVDSAGLPVLGACVEIYNGESFITASRTYATGLTLFFPNLSDRTRYLQDFRVVVTKGDTRTESSLDRSAIGGLTSVTLPISQAQTTVQLDVMFLLDATGSMGDEISQLQSNILAISSELDALPSGVDVRFGLVSYRDRGDEYVTRVYDFTDDVQVFQNDLLNVQAGGGGDYPESLNEGFHMALNAVNWRGEDTIKLVILVADAPPHVDYPNDADYSILMQDALARGIKVHPIASSGLQPEGEFILRQIGQFTMGHFLFLTYDGGVAGTTGEDRPDLEVGEARDEQGVGDYSVEQLDELVLRLITDEIAALQGQ